MIVCGSCGASNIDTARFCEACGKPLDKPAEAGLSGLHTIDPSLEQRKQESAGSPLDLKPDDVFADRYRIIEEIGRGGMGVVYRANDPVTQRDVALKLIRGDRLAGNDAVKRLVREGVLARDIRHPNVVAVYDVGEVKGLPFLTMELLGGQSLRAWMQKQMREGGEASMAMAANIVREILNGLAAAHAQGVIHRDLKPENIILLAEPTDRDARLKILDFGIARAGGISDTGSTSLGTLEYMAPEQVTAPEATQASADFYSLSVIFYELLIGVVPKGHWQPPSGGRSDVPPAIDKLVERGLSNNPRQRPHTAQHYLAELESALAGQDMRPQPAPQPGPSPQPAPQPQPAPAGAGANPFLAFFQNMTPMKMGIVGVVIILVIGGGFAAMLEGGDPPSSPPPQQIVNNPDPVNPEPVYNPPVNPVTPVQPAALPPPDTSNYGILSGTWTDTINNVIQVSVSPYGEVSGQVIGGGFAGYGFYGEFAGTVLQYAIVDGQGQPITGGVAQWTNICHLEYPEVDPYGQFTGRSIQIHVRHVPPAKCF
ncbi:MAG: serine/threonine-protein kinase [Hyphomonadaceae bacterium]